MQPFDEDFPRESLADILPPIVPQPGKTYSAAEVAQVAADFRNHLRAIVVQHPELALVRDEYEDLVHHETEPLKEIAALFAACGQVLMQLKHLMNPTALPLHMSADGRVLAHTFKDVATFVTDIRGFTELTENVPKVWGINVFKLLSYCYFPQVTEVLERYGCHYLNYTGDGLLVLATGRKNAEGRLLLPSLDTAVLCAMDLVALTNSIAETWRRMGLVQACGEWHETGLGLTGGDVEVGDPFVPDKDFRGPCARFNEVLGTVLAEWMPHFQPRNNFSWRVRGIHALSPAINRASRLQDIDKLVPQHTCMMTTCDVARLCPPLQEWFQPVIKVKLKGIGEVDVCGFDRFAHIAVPELEKKCLDYYAVPRA